ncbi:DUF262 domain-containing protein [Desulfobacterales bacterium HSG2]|nr:DUF262 domain-containing protein [Desulfobacterales bacterium HSG2]
MSLQQEIEKKAKEIHSDGYSLSIGGLISLYRDKELDLHPEFQRFFRWNLLQKTRFVESLLIGIPIPSIFVYQREDGVWDVIDGVRRLSAIFEFVGILEDEAGEKYAPLRLTGTDYLPSLEGKMWRNEEEEDDDDDSDPENYFTMFQRIELKRVRLDIKIIKEENEQDAGYELFRRINTGGISLSEQEVRNFLLVMISKDFFLSFFRKLASYPPFLQCIASFPDSVFGEQHELELVSRFLVFRSSDTEDIRKSPALSDFVTNKMTEFARSDDFNTNREKEIFERTFNLLLGMLKDDAFRKFDKHSDSFSGGFSMAAYEIIATGIGANIDKWEDADTDKIKMKIRSLWENRRFKSWEKSGDDKERVLHLLPLAEEWFGRED